MQLRSNTYQQFYGAALLDISGPKRHIVHIRFSEETRELTLYWAEDSDSSQVAQWVYVASANSWASLPTEAQGERLEWVPQCTSRQDIASGSFHLVCFYGRRVQDLKRERQARISEMRDLLDSLLEEEFAAFKAKLRTETLRPPDLLDGRRVLSGEDV